MIAFPVSVSATGDEVEVEGNGDPFVSFAGRMTGLVALRPMLITRLYAARSRLAVRSVKAASNLPNGLPQTVFIFNQRHAEKSFSHLAET